MFVFASHADLGSFAPFGSYPAFDSAQESSLQIQKRENMKNIYVGNLSYTTSEDTVRSLFEAHGTVDNVSIVRDRDSGQPKGFGFVEMANDGEANQAMAALNGRDVDGRTLNVNEARPRAERGFGGGNRSGGQRRNRW